jgi:hypothetical protein
LHTYATVKQSCRTLFITSFHAFRVYYLSLTRLTHATIILSAIYGLHSYFIYHQIRCPTTQLYNLIQSIIHSKSTVKECQSKTDHKPYHLQSRDESKQSCNQELLLSSSLFNSIIPTTSFLGLSSNNQIKQI